VKVAIVHDWLNQVGGAEEVLEALVELFPGAPVYTLICRAFVFPGLEDFGIAPVQAMAAGRPVIAYAGGGALDYVVEGVTGVFFQEQTPESLAEAVRRFDESAFDPARIRAHAEGFDTYVFKSKLRIFIQEQVRNSWS